MTGVAFGVAALVAGALATAALTVGRLRWVGFACALAGLAGPLLAPWTFVRGGLGLIEALLLMRAVDLVRVRERWGFFQRLRHLVSPVDTRLLEPVTSWFDRAAAVRLVAAVGLAAAGWLLMPVVWWAAGVMMAYGLVEVIWAVAHVTYAGLGWKPPRLHEHPVLSRTVRELWGVRWAQPIRQFLQMNIVRIWGRKNLRLGLLLSFVMSGVAHGYVILVCVGLVPAAAMVGFFTVQGLFVLVEIWIGASKWKPVAGHAWTVVVMLGSSPLFTWPMLMCLTW